MVVFFGGGGGGSIGDRVAWRVLDFNLFSGETLKIQGLGLKVKYLRIILKGVSCWPFLAATRFSSNFKIP